MDKKRRQMIKLVVIELVMVILIVIMLVVFVLLAMGYQINQEGKLEQNGLLQMISVPTGATINIDGQRLSTRTNANKMLADGSHRIRLERAGYEAWEKTVKIRAGIFTQLTARLWPTTLELEDIRNISPKLLAWQELPNRERILMVEEATPTKWHLINSRNPRVEADEVIEMSAVMQRYLEKDGKIAQREVCKSGKIWLKECEKEIKLAVKLEKIKWAKREQRAIVAVRSIRADLQENLDWWLVDFRSPEKSIKVGGVIDEVEYGKCEKNKAMETKTQCKKTWRKDWLEMEFTNEDGGEKLVGRTIENEVFEVMARENGVKYTMIADRVSAMTLIDGDVLYIKDDEAGSKLWSYVDTGTEVMGFSEKNLCLKAWRYADRNYLAIIKNNQKVEIYRGELPIREKEEWRSEKIAEQMVGSGAEDGCRTEIGEKAGLVWLKFLTGDNIFFNSKEESLVQNRWRFEEFLADGVMMRAEKRKLVMQEYDGANQRELLPISEVLGTRGVVLTTDDRFLLVMIQENDQLVMKRVKLFS